MMNVLSRFVVSDHNVETDLVNVYYIEVTVSSTPHANPQTVIDVDGFKFRNNIVNPQFIFKVTITGPACYFLPFEPVIDTVVQTHTALAIDATDKEGDFDLNLEDDVSTLVLLE